MATHGSIFHDERVLIFCCLQSTPHWGCRGRPKETDCKVLVSAKEICFSNKAKHSAGGYSIGCCCSSTCFPSHSFHEVVASYFLISGILRWFVSLYTTTLLPEICATQTHIEPDSWTGGADCSFTVWISKGGCTRKIAFRGVSWAFQDHIDTWGNKRSLFFSKSRTIHV